MKISPLILTTVLAVVSVGHMAGAEDAAGLRAEAAKWFSPLPDRMPGGEADTPAQVKLGHKLFFDKRLSANRKLSCATCHEREAKTDAYEAPNVVKGFSPRSSRNSPTILNAGFHIAQFWDGRAADLVAQAREPMMSTNEMGMPDPAELLARLRKEGGYPALFGRAYPEASDPVNLDHVVQAIAAYERTLITRDRFDDFLKGDDGALSSKEKQGLRTFLAVGCQQCHDGPLLGGNAFKQLGVKHPYANTNDIGRALVTRKDEDRYWFKTAALRNVAFTGPYFHDGKVPTLDAAIAEMAYLQLDRRLSPAEVQSIALFLQTLTDKRVAREIPRHSTRTPR